MSGDFKATPFARLFFCIFWKGLVRKSTIWALLIFCIPELKKKITYVFPNELPNWKRIHKGTFPKKTPMYSRMNCLIENEYTKGTFQKKITYVFTNELPNWKRIHKGNFPKKTKKMYSRMNCLIENEYIKGTFPPQKKTPMYSRMNCLIENEY